MNRLMAWSNIGWIVPRHKSEPYEFVTSPPVKIGDECLIRAEGKMRKVIWLRLRLTNGITNRPIYRRMLVETGRA